MGMREADEDPMTVLSTLIAQAEAHRVDQMLRIADLIGDGQPADEGLVTLVGWGLAGVGEAP